MASAAAFAAYAHELQIWSIQLIGVISDEYTLRAATRNCLAGLRAKGVIN